MSWNFNFKIEIEIPNSDVILLHCIHDCALAQAARTAMLRPTEHPLGVSNVPPEPGARL
jgi:hypothetical protein